MRAGAGNILVIRFSSLGDVVLATAALRQLRRLYPRGRITFATKAAFAPLVAGHPAVDRVLLLDAKGAHRGLRGALAFAWEARRRFDLVVDLHGSLRSRLVCALSGAAVLRVDKGLWARRFLVWFKRRVAAQGGHVSERYLETLAPLAPAGFKPEAPIPDLHVAPPARAWAARFLKARGLRRGESLVAVAPGAAWATKRWTTRGFAGVLENLARPGRRFLLVGGREDLVACEDLLHRVPKLAARCILSAGETSLAQLAGLVERCDLMVCNDSGPMHVAVGLGVPVAAVFGPTVTQFGFRPLGPRDKVIEADLSCRPCSLHGGNACPIGTHECMEAVKPESVVRAARELLRKA